MKPILRPFQKAAVAAVAAAWAIAASSNVLLVSATGTGKTVMLADVVHAEPAATCVIAHRQELVGQISQALARCGVRHRIIGADDVRRACSTEHMQDFGVNYIDANSRVAVASVDTLVRMDPKDPWFKSVKLKVLDEAHHALQTNKWGRAWEMFPNARGLGVTATPLRADGAGLGAWNDGVFHSMVEAPGMRDVIAMGFLTDYRIFCPPSTLNLTEVPTAPSGDFSPKPLKAAVHVSSITGDVVKEYLRIAPGKLGITFAIDIEEAGLIAEGFRAAGVPAEVVSSKTPKDLRRSIMRRFKAREILQLVNVDLMGEGVDVPAIEVVSMARPTQSFGLYVQQFGRALRLMAGKAWAIIIDHVGNVMRHGLPDKRREWSLERTTKAKKVDEDIIPLTICDDCSRPYERIKSACPHCTKKPVPACRSAPEFVDGDLFELDPDTLAKMRGDVMAVDNLDGPIPYNAEPWVVAGIKNKRWAKQQAQVELRSTMELWAGWQRHQGRTDSEIYRLFYLVYNMDMLSAQVLPPTAANELRDKLQVRLTANNVVPA